MFIRTQTSKDDPSESFYGSPTIMANGGGIIWELDGIEGNDSEIIIGIGVAVFSGSKKLDALKTGEKIYVNALATKVAVPTSVTAKAKSKYEISVSWKKTGAKSYNVYRSTSKNGAYRKIGTTKKNSYSDKEIIQGTTYYYKVTSVNSNRDTEFSSAASAKAAPPAPKNVKASRLKLGIAEITWEEATSADGYIVYMSESKDGTYNVSTYTNDISLTKSGLKSGKTYYFKVCSYCVASDGSDKKDVGVASNIVSVKV